MERAVGRVGVFYKACGNQQAWPFDDYGIVEASKGANDSNGFQVGAQHSGARLEPIEDQHGVAYDDAVVRGAKLARATPLSSRNPLHRATGAEYRRWLELLEDPVSPTRVDVNRHRFPVQRPGAVVGAERDQRAQRNGAAWTGWFVRHRLQRWRLGNRRLHPEQSGDQRVMKAVRHVISGAAAFRSLRGGSRFLRTWRVSSLQS